MTMNAPEPSSAVEATHPGTIFTAAPKTRTSGLPPASRMKIGGTLVRGISVPPPAATEEEAQRTDEAVAKTIAAFTNDWRGASPGGVLNAHGELIRGDHEGVYASILRYFQQAGIGYGAVEEGASPSKLHLDAFGVLQYRHALIDELGVNSTAEFMLLDMALAAYSRAMYLDHLVGGLGNKKGTEGSDFREQDLKMTAKLADMGGRYRREFRECLKALRETKAPPLTVRITNADKVAVQVNHNGPATVREGEP